MSYSLCCRRVNSANINASVEVVCVRPKMSAFLPFLVRRGQSMTAIYITPSLFAHLIGFASTKYFLLEQEENREIPSLATEGRLKRRFENFR
ncbi:hypothetical protein AVEN_148718-1 [Araneus ventricosus]|uniref:Uncharacterized protein n=1 Tax=Araneus ventricosus TaxID=182803 RepID=A0A4Y2WHH8_ARAVE|nr:hypothetical protein AVEN_227052-1 [Araneus ventricosus]GBO36649.1 hypothetical protein AVEN_148718-1 [Araneus ventricosus]